MADCFLSSRCLGALQMMHSEHRDVHTVSCSALCKAYQGICSIHTLAAPDGLTRLRTHSGGGFEGQACAGASRHGEPARPHSPRIRAVQDLCHSGRHPCVRIACIVLFMASMHTQHLFLGNPCPCAQRRGVTWNAQASTQHCRSAASGLSQDFVFCAEICDWPSECGG